MLRYMGQIFVGGALGPALGHAFGFVVSIVFALLLLSAVNTAIVDLITIQFLMSRDREVPNNFSAAQQMGRAKRRHGARDTVVPMLLVLARQRHGRPRRSLCSRRGRRDRHKSRRDCNRPKAVDQSLGSAR